MTRVKNPEYPHLEYDPDVGRFFRIASTGRGGVMGGIVPLYLNANGYPLLSTPKGKSRLAHRVAWAFMTGSERDPAQPLDHINGDRSDTRWCNLRAATPALNTQNRGLGVNNTSGVLGVCWDKQSRKWKARVNILGKQKVSLNKCFGAAVKARRALEREHFERGFIGSKRLAYSGVSK